MRGDLTSDSEVNPPHIHAGRIEGEYHPQPAPDERGGIRASLDARRTRARSAAYSVRAYVTATTEQAPASTSARAQASSVDPVVCTSSTSSTATSTAPSASTTI